METEEKCCRLCITTDEDNAFEPLSAEILKAVADLNITIADTTTGVICAKCKADVEAARKVCNRILDASEYFKIQQATQKIEPAPKTSKIVYECDACSATFENIESLEAHIAAHNPFTCFFCIQKFSSVDQRRVHLYSEHEDKTKKLIELLAYTGHP